MSEPERLRQQRETIKQIHEAAYGKPFRFSPRHHWIYDWMKEQPGTSLPDKLYRIVEAAYKADHLRRGHEAFSAYRVLPLLTKADHGKALDLVNQACDSFARAGDVTWQETSRRTLGWLIQQMSNYEGGS
ncbi:MAG: hypothetical protein WCG26_01120 [Chloroflexales bacterium]